MVVLLVLATEAHSFALFRCKFTGLARTACCCPGSEEVEDSATISRACCCSVEQVDASMPAGAQGPQSPAQHVVAAPALWLPELRLPTVRMLSLQPPPSAGMRRYAERTRAGPSLIIVHRRLLI
ncbi:MAG TPA: hypothetical protein VJU61_21155 [Polyangiaceae bacterium]|nr:hypothetical protein [Polyangiaceae bacterium]